MTILAQPHHAVRGLSTAALSPAPAIVGVIVTVGSASAVATVDTVVHAGGLKNQQFPLMQTPIAFEPVAPVAPSPSCRPSRGFGGVTVQSAAAPHGRP